jgi:hypothetical protein
MNRRSNRRRPHNNKGRAVRLGSTVAIDPSAIRATLRDKQIGGIDRLILLVAIASGMPSMSLAELRRAVCGEVLDAGGVQAAIRNREIILR